MRRLLWLSSVLLVVVLLTAAPAWAEFPQIADVQHSFNTVDGTSHVITLPRGYLADELLIIIYAVDGAPTVSAGWTGWTQLYTKADGDSAHVMEVRYKVASGSEGASVTLTSSASEQFGALALRIRCYTGTPEAGTAVATAAASPSTTPDAPSLTASWGSADNLWLVVITTDDGRRTLRIIGNGDADHFTVSSAVSNTSAGATAHMGWAKIATDIEDPPVYTLTAADDWTANTIVVRGAACPAGASGGRGVIGG